MAFNGGRKVLAMVALVIAAVTFYQFRWAPVQEAQRRDDPPRGSRFAKFSVGDSVTSDIRNRARKLARVEIESPQDRSKAAKLGTIVEDFGSSVIISKNKNADLAPSGLRSKAIDGKIHLPGAKFDPIAEPKSETVVPNSPEGLADNDYYVVQFGGVATDEWIESLRDAGIEILQYLPENAFFVYGDRASIAKAATHSRVRWTGRIAPSQKVPEILREQLSAEKSKSLLRPSVSHLERTSTETAVFDIAVFSRADLEGVTAEIIRSSGASVKNVSRLANNFFNVVRAEVPLANVERIAAITDVIRIDAWSRPVKEDERSSQIVAGNYTGTGSIVGPGYDPLSQFGVNGNGVTVSVVDDGVTVGAAGTFYLTGANTVNGPLRGAVVGASGGHGHLNASIIAGSSPFSSLDPLGYNYGLGVAPAANIINIPLLLASYTGTEADAYNDTITTAGQNGRVGYISNNSWGSGLNSNAYDSYTAQFDGFVRDSAAGALIQPLVLVFSAGNEGPTSASLTRPKSAKNIISVGNSENIRTEFGGSNADNIDDLRGSSSRGPTADGRIKPDIIAPGSYITGSRAGDCTSVTRCFDDNHVYSIGTSHSAPQVSGAAALFTQFWRDGHFGQNPRPALVKAAIINTGQEMNGLNTSTASLPNGNEGWGRINMKFMLNTGVAMKYVNETEPLSNVGENYTLNGSVGIAAKPVRISLVWTDPPAAADPALVNNLDLSVTVNGNTYRGNVFSGGLSATGGNADTVNNVENVWLPAGIQAGTPITIKVTAASLNGDGILGNNDFTDQHFALVAYNVGEPVAVVPVTRAPMDFDGDHKTDVSVFRPTTQTWWLSRSSDSVATAATFGGVSTPGVPVPADYTGDGKADIAVWRASDGAWLILRSEDSSYYLLPFGASGDIPAAGDFDGDGKADPTIFRPSSGTWFILLSSGGTAIRSFGTVGDQPVVGDYDGDGVADVAIYRPSLGQWWILRSSAGLIAYTFGIPTDRAVPGDYTGDGKTDVAIWRPSNGNWFILRSEDSSYYSLPFGSDTDLPTPGDYDGDGKIDTAVFRPSTGTWFVNRSTAGVLITNFGANGDTPTPNSFVR